MEEPVWNVGAMLLPATLAVRSSCETMPSTAAVAAAAATPTACDMYFAQEDGLSRRAEGFRSLALFLLLSLAFDVMKQTQGGHGISLSGPQTSRTPAAHPRAPTPAGRKGSDSLGRQQNAYLALHVQEAERNESRPAPKSGSRAPTDRGKVR